MSDRLPLGIALSLLAFFCFSMVDVSAKWLATTAAIPALQLGFFRYFGHFVVTLMQSVRQGSLSSFALERSTAPLLLFRAFLLAACTTCNFVAITYLPLTTIATITFSAPLFVCALSGPMLGERVGPWRWGAIAVGFLGVVVAMRPQSGFHWSMLFSVGAALGFALYSLMSRKLAGRVSVASMQLYTGLVGTVALAPFAGYVWQSPQEPGHWVILTAIGIIAWFGHELFTRAHAFAPASALTPFSYSLFLYMCVWGWLIFDQMPDRSTYLALALVVTAGIVIWWRETKLKTNKNKGSSPS